MTGNNLSISFSAQSLETAKQKMRDDFSSREGRLRKNTPLDSGQNSAVEISISDAARLRYEQFAQGFQMRTMNELSELTGYSVEDIRKWRTSLSALHEELWAQNILDFESRPIELRTFSWGSRNLYDIIRGVEIDESLDRDLGHFLFVDIKDAPIEVRIANSLAHHISAFHFVDEGARNIKVAMYREAAMRMALHFAENHLSQGAASLFMAEMRAMKEVSIRMTQDIGSSLMPLRVSDVREHHLRYGDSPTQMAGFVTHAKTVEVIAAAENFDTWIDDDMFSSVREWMERIKADIALL
ncbi:MAG: hypothetical protein FWF81_00370 [Defluviitaleaceae bacterium]|nr:hypothetical protein [Defluviitaleaceae bacterium]